MAELRLKGTWGLGLKIGMGAGFAARVLGFVEIALEAFSRVRRPCREEEGASGFEAERAGAVVRSRTESSSAKDKA
jgi:hypothetical protein